MAIKLTREGFEKMKKEWIFLKTVKRKEAISAVKVARERGDLSENAEYDAAKEEQYLLEKRISDLQAKLSDIQIIDNEAISSDKVYLGAKVTLEELGSNGTVLYMIVSEEEADLGVGKISAESPVGRALLGKAVGETGVVTLPRGIVKYKIRKIER